MIRVLRVGIGDRHLLRCSSYNNRAPAPFASLTPSQPAFELGDFGRQGG